MLRRRRVNLKTVSQFDAFPKVPETYTNKTAVGGTFSFITFCLISWLVISETRYFLNARLFFKFKPDTDFEDKLKINIDITVATPCSQLGADVHDSTKENMVGFEILSEEETWWELDQDQRSHFEAMKHMNSFLREEYHAIHKLLWQTNQVVIAGEMPKRTVMPDSRPDACRFHGSINVNKVAGSFHITAGKPLSLPQGHIHLSAFIMNKDFNFTHRINKFSFGEASPGIIQPLDGDEKITDDSMTLYQYFIEVVPTDIQTMLRTTKAYQYSVKEYQRPINHHKGSHGIPGIFFKYDTSALKIHVTQNRESLIQFLVKLCGLVGGIFVTSGLINSFVQSFWYVVSCKFWRKIAKENDEQDTKNILKTPLNLVDVSTPEKIDFTLNPQ